MAPARTTLVVASLGYFMVILDATIVNIALPTIGHDLGAGLRALEWVVDGYTLTFAAALLTGGALGDSFGARNARALPAPASASCKSSTSSWSDC